MQLFKPFDHPGDNSKVSLAFQLIFGNSTGAMEWPRQLEEIVLLVTFVTLEK